MQALECQGEDLSYLMLHPDDYTSEKSYPLIILLHGYGANMYDLANIVPMIGQQYIYACPNGPIEVDFGMGQYGYSWRPPRDGTIQIEASTIERALERFFHGVMSDYHIPDGNAILLGFSQGGGMTYRLGLTNSDLFGGLVVLGSGFPDEMKETLPQDRRLPIFIGHGIQDNIERAQMANTFLREAGYSVTYHEYPIGHEITQQVLDDIAPWVRKLVNSSSVAG